MALCSTHYVQKSRGRELKPIRPQLNAHQVLPCTYPGCGHDQYAKTLCNSHYAQQYRGQELTPIREKMSRAGTCTVEGCDIVIYARRQCSGHYQKSRRAARKEGSQS